MKTLILLRHARAAEGSPDHDRPLDDCGLADAARIGHLLRSAGLQPGAALVSDARRTADTFHVVAGVLAHVPRLTLEPRLYNATPDRILGLVRGVTEPLAHLLVIAHNPGIGDAARRLATQGSEADLASLASGFSTGSCAVLEVPASRWSELGNTGVLTHLFCPQRA